MVRLSQLSDEELLHHVLNTRDPLTSTDLEMCLADRLTKRITHCDQLQTIAKDLTEKVEELRALA